MHALTLIVRVTRDDRKTALAQGLKGAWADVDREEIPSVGELFNPDPAASPLKVQRVLAAEPNSEEERIRVYFSAPLAVIETLIASSLAGTSEVWWVAEEP